jgi:hypothetical protein
MASQATVVPQANEIADEAGRPRIFVMLERLLLAGWSYYDQHQISRYSSARNSIRTGKNQVSSLGAMPERDASIEGRDLLARSLLKPLHPSS